MLWIWEFLMQSPDLGWRLVRSGRFEIYPSELRLTIQWDRRCKKLQSGHRRPCAPNTTLNTLAAIKYAPPLSNAQSIREGTRIATGPGLLRNALNNLGILARVAPGESKSLSKNAEQRSK